MLKDSLGLRTGLTNLGNFRLRSALLRALLLPPRHDAAPGGRADVVRHGPVLRSHGPEGGGNTRLRIDKCGSPVPVSFCVCVCSINCFLFFVFFFLGGGWVRIRFNPKGDGSLELHMYMYFVPGFESRARLRLFLPMHPKPRFILGG